MFYSKPGTFYFIDRIKSWMRRQDGRLWCMIPFWDSVGVAMINACKAEDLRIICRPGETAKYLKDGVQVRFDPEGHSKIIVGDSAAMLGSFNLTYQSMFDNQENATYSRSNDYSEFFLEVWERARIPGEPEG